MTEGVALYDSYCAALYHRHYGLAEKIKLATEYTIEDDIKYFRPKYESEVIPIEHVKFFHEIIDDFGDHLSLIKDQEQREKLAKNIFVFGGTYKQFDTQCM